MEKEIRDIVTKKFIEFLKDVNPETVKEVLEGNEVKDDAQYELLNLVYIDFMNDVIIDTENFKKVCGISQEILNLLGKELGYPEYNDDGETK